MADEDLLNRVVEAQGPSNRDVVDAVQQNQWASTFSNTPPAEVLRSRVNLADTVNRAFDNKIALQARSDAKALDLMQKTARFNEYQDQAPLREELLKAHVAATGATERRKAMEATMENNQTAALNQGVLKLYQVGAQKGTPEFQSGLIDLISSNPHANISHLAELGKLAGAPEDVDPVAFAREGKAFKEAAIKAGLKNPRVTTVGGKWTVSEGPEIVTPEHKLANEVTREKALQEVRSAGKPKTSTPEQKAALFQDAVVNGKLSFGMPNASGDGVTPNTDSDATKDHKATHVTSFYQNPLTGKIETTKPMTIDEFKSLQEKATERKSSPKNVTTAEEFHALPSGSEFIDPQGVKRRKP